MLEWYRAHEPYEALMDDCAASAGRGGTRGWRGAIRLSRQSGRSFCGRGALDRRRGILAPRRHRSAGDGPQRKGDRAALAAQAEKGGDRHSRQRQWADIFSRVLVERVDPHLGVGRATILYEYPLPLAALARAKPGSDKVAERFELYACGVELANAFGELSDPAEQRAALKRRWRRRNACMASAIRSMRIFSPRWRGMPPRERHCARLRPAGDAGDRRAADRPGDLDAGGRAMTEGR